MSTPFGADWNRAAWPPHVGHSGSVSPQTWRDRYSWSKLRQRWLNSGQRLLTRHGSLRLALLVALVWLAVGASQLTHQWRDGWREYRAASAVMLLVAGTTQLLLTRRMAHERRFTGLDFRQLRAVTLWQCVVLSVAVGMGLLLGPAPEARYVARAVAAWGWSVSLAVLVFPGWRERLQRWDHVRGIHVVAVCTLWLSVSFVTSESLCWTIDRVAGIEPRSRVQVQTAKLPPGSEFRGSKVNQLGYWDDEFQPESDPRLLRVAVLGHDVPLSGDARSNCLAQLERQLPNVEVYNFGLRQSGPREFVTQFESDVARYRPQLVLTFINVGDDLLEPGEAPRDYDWRSLRTVQWTAHSLRMPLFGPSVPLEPLPAGLSFEQRLHVEAARLSICRTPLDAPMQRRYRELAQQLERLAKRCAKHHVPMTLVLVPSEFQVMPTLRESLLRRAGYEPRQIDLELPQRQLASFAHAQQLPLVDLLPYFRSASSAPYASDTGELSATGRELIVQVLDGWLQSRYGNQLAGTN